MGVSRFTHSGPYVECKFRMKAGKSTKRMCPNWVCKRYAEEKWVDTDQFCTDCGTAITDVEFAVEVADVDWFSLEEELDGVLFEPFGELANDLSDQSLHIWIGYDNDDEHESDDSAHFVKENESLKEVRPADIERDLCKFEKRYPRELKRLRAAYGSDNVTVKWGVIVSVTY